MEEEKLLSEQYYLLCCESNIKHECEHISKLKDVLKRKRKYHRKLFCLHKRELKLVSDLELLNDRLSDINFELEEINKNVTEQKDIVIDYDTPMKHDYDPYYDFPIVVRFLSNTELSRSDVIELHSEAEPNS